MQQLDDLALINLIIQRDEAALGELFDRYHRLVFSIAMNVVSRREDAEEITLDIFTRVWEKAHTYRSERAQVSTWLTRMSRNRSIDLLRREESRPMKHSVSWADAPTVSADASANPEPSTQLALQRRSVREAVASLPQNQREVLALAYFRGYSHSQIAAELELPLGTVKARIRSGMQKLRAKLLDE